LIRGRHERRVQVGDAIASARERGGEGADVGIDLSSSIFIHETRLGAEFGFLGGIAVLAVAPVERDRNADAH
jgi:hypothetical protein